MAQRARLDQCIIYPDIAHNPLLSILPRTGIWTPTVALPQSFHQTNKFSQYTAPMIHHSLAHSLTNPLPTPQHSQYSFPIPILSIRPCCLRYSHTFHSFSHHHPSLPPPPLRPSHAAMFILLYIAVRTHLLLD